MLDAPNASFGFTPRMHPRPKYPNLLTVVVSFIKGCLIEGAFLSTVVSYIFYSWYRGSITQLRQLFPGSSDQFIFTILLSVSHVFIWTAVNIPLFICDTFGYYQDYKLHRSKGQIPNAKLINHTFITAVVSQLITSPVMGFYMYPTFVYFGMLSLDAQFPTALEMIKTYSIGYIFNDTFFYFTHRMLHMKALYFLHKQHHSYAGTMGISAEVTTCTIVRTYVLCTSTPSNF